MSIDEQLNETAICDGVELTFQDFDLAERCVARSRVRRAGAEFEIRVIVRISPVLSQSSSLRPTELDVAPAYVPAKRLFQPHVHTALSMEG